MAAGAAAAAVAEGHIEGNGNRTVHAATPDAVATVIARLDQNDSTCTTAVLSLQPPYPDQVTSLADALRGNTVLTSLKLILLDPEGTDAITNEEGPLHRALDFNTSVVVLSLKGISVPAAWEQIVRRNTCLAIPAPPPLQHPRADGDVDLRQVPWALPAGDHFKSLNLQDRIGHGAMGEVFRVEIDGNVMAAKVAFAFQSPDLYGLEEPEARRGAVAECMRELAALRNLDGHPHVVGFRCVFYTLFEDQPMPTWICMDLEVATLHNRIRERKVDFLRDMLGIVTGLEFIHSHGMMHRDIKPKNILIGKDGKVRIGDLGLTKVSHMLSSRVAAGHTPIGTPAYLAPDAQGTAYDVGRDVYAAGVTGVEMVLRESPKATHHERLVQIQRAVDAEPQYKWFFNRCTAPVSASRPSCRGMMLAFTEEVIHAGARAVESERDAEKARADAAVREHTLAQEEHIRALEQVSHELEEALALFERKRQQVHDQEFTLQRMRTIHKTERDEWERERLQVQEKHERAVERMRAEFASERASSEAKLKEKEESLTMLEKTLANQQVREAPMLHRAENRFVPSVQEEDAPGKSMLDEARMTLNKLTLEKFDKLSVRLLELGLSNPDQLPAFTSMIFQRVIDEPFYCAVYSKLCKALHDMALERSAIITKPGTDELTPIASHFKSLLLNNCQQQFEKAEENALRAREAEVAAREKDPDPVELETLSKMPRAAREKYELNLREEKRDAAFRVAKLRRHIIGNITFIGELFLVDMATEPIVRFCIEKLLTRAQSDEGTKEHREESLEQLCKLLETAGAKLEQKYRKKAKGRGVDLSGKWEDYFKQMATIASSGAVSSRIQLAIQLVIDMRKAGWKARNTKKGPKTIDEIHREAKHELKRKLKVDAIVAEHYQQSRRGRGRGSRGRGRGRGGKASRVPPPVSRPPVSWVDVQRQSAENMFGSVGGFRRTFLDWAD